MCITASPTRVTSGKGKKTKKNIAVNQNRNPTPQLCQVSARERCRTALQKALNLESLTSLQRFLDRFQIPPPHTEDKAFSSIQGQLLAEHIFSKNGKLWCKWDCTVRGRAEAR